MAYLNVYLLPVLFFPAIAPADSPKPVTLGSLQATPPAEWQAEKPANRLRSHQFRLPADEEGVADGEIYVMPESSPKVDSYFPRWKASFVPPEGQTLDEVAKESQFQVGKATVHLLDVSGTWKYRERPFDPRSKEELRPEYRVVWAIVVVGDEATHIRLSGPEHVVQKYYNGFEDWLKRMK
jgi:hypothetical protein